LTILEWPHEALRTKCEEIMAIDQRTWLLLDEMWKALDAVKDDAMALAANQVGAMIRLFIMRDSDGNKYECLNPVWEPIKEDGWACEDEGCLSTPGLFEQVYGRYQKVKLVFLDRNGCKTTIEALGIDAVCIQHEVDHLDGVFLVPTDEKNTKTADVGRMEEKRWKTCSSKHLRNGGKGSRTQNHVCQGWVNSASAMKGHKY